MEIWLVTRNQFNGETTVSLCCTELDALRHACKMIANSLQANGDENSETEKMIGDTINAGKYQDAIDLWNGHMQVWHNTCQNITIERRAVLENVRSPVSIFCNENE
jgi:hypothetical protein